MWVSLWIYTILMRKEFNRMSWVFSWYSGCPQRECWQGALGLVPNLHGLSPYWPTVARSMCSSFVISHRWLSEALLYTKPPTRSCWGNSFAGVASRLLSTSIRTTITTLLIYLLTDLNCVTTVKPHIMHMYTSLKFENIFSLLKL
jgi:hypothetical protein